MDTRTAPAAADHRPVNLPIGHVVLGAEHSRIRRAPEVFLTVGPQGPLDERGRLLHHDDVAAQLVLSLANVVAVLEAAGLTTHDLAQLHVSTTDLDAVLSSLDTLVELLQPAGGVPPLSLVEVRRLPVPGMAVQIEGLAIR